MKKGKQLPLTRINFSTMKLQHLNRKMMTVSNLAYLLAEEMKNHIGRDNAIAGDELFMHIYRHERKPDYVDDFRWEYVRRAMNKLRTQTKLFIVFEKSKTTGQFMFFVPTEVEETEEYRTVLEKNMVKMRAAQQRAVKSVQQKWYELDWIGESKQLTEYKEMVAKRTQKKLE